MGFFDFLCDLFGIGDDEELEGKERPKYTIKKSQMSECEKYFYDILYKTFFEWLWYSPTSSTI